MRNPLLTDGQKLQPLSQWKRELRGYTLEKNDVNYNVLNCRLEVKLQLFNIDTMPRKDYERQYKRQIRFKPQNGFMVAEFAAYKFTTPKTIYNNLNKLAVIKGTTPVRIKSDEIFNWNPSK